MERMPLLPKELEESGKLPESADVDVHTLFVINPHKLVLPAGYSVYNWGGYPYIYKDEGAKEEREYYWELGIFTGRINAISLEFKNYIPNLRINCRKAGGRCEKFRRQAGDILLHPEYYSEETKALPEEVRGCWGCPLHEEHWKSGIEVYDRQELCKEIKPIISAYSTSANCVYIAKEIPKGNNGKELRPLYYKSFKTILGGNTEIVLYYYVLLRWYTSEDGDVKEYSRLDTVKEMMKEEERLEKEAGRVDNEKRSYEEKRKWVREREEEAREAKKAYVAKAKEVQGEYKERVRKVEEEYEEKRERLRELEDRARATKEQYEAKMKEEKGVYEERVRKAEEEYEAKRKWVREREAEAKKAKENYVAKAKEVKKDYEERVREAKEKYLLLEQSCKEKYNKKEKELEVQKEKYLLLEQSCKEKYSKKERELEVQKEKYFLLEQSCKEKYSKKERELEERYSKKSLDSEQLGKVIAEAIAQMNK